MTIHDFRCDYPNGPCRCNDFYLWSLGTKQTPPLAAAQFKSPFSVEVQAAIDSMQPYSKKLLEGLIAPAENQEIESLLGHIRRLEKSNQELGEQLHRCQNPGEVKGWD